MIATSVTISIIQVNYYNVEVSFSMVVGYYYYHFERVVVGKVLRVVEIRMRTYVSKIVDLANQMFDSVIGL